MTDQLHFQDQAARHAAMRKRDKEMIPRALLRAMLVLALASLAIVTFAVVTDRPLVGQPKPAEVLAERSLTLDGTRLGAVTVHDADGTLLADYGPREAGFISVIWRGLDRERLKHGIAGNPPVTIRRLANGRLSLHDPATAWRVELAYFGDANADRFAALIDQ